jgi:ATP-dependent helicase YprA (DUF1998 family)/very-short-patch-repair endonuclease
VDVFDLRNKLISDFSSYVESFITIQDERIKEYIDQCFRNGFLWPDPLIQLNPSFEHGGFIGGLVSSGMLHEECLRIFRKDKTAHDSGIELNLHKHQADAISIAREGNNYVLTTGTGSGKSLAYIIPITDYILRHGSGNGIKAIVVYPMNALANSQYGELKKFLCDGYPDGVGPVSFAQYTGQEGEEERERIIAYPPDILLTNYVMLELILTRPKENALIKAAKGLKFLVLDELHTYRGRQGADVAMLIRRVANRLAPEGMQYIGTSATLAGKGTFKQQRIEVARVASLIFGSKVLPEHVIGEALRRATDEIDLYNPDFIKVLKKTIADSSLYPPREYNDLIHNPMAIWIENTFGVTRDETGRLVRSKPQSITGQEGATRKLSELCELPTDICENAIKSYLLAGYNCQHPVTGFPLFPFRLHQFISRGDTVYTSLESEEKRYITIKAQQYVPDGKRDRFLYPLVFCRECGQEFYRVIMSKNEETGSTFFEARVEDDLLEDNKAFGYLYLNHDDPWPENLEEQIERLPDNWIEEFRGGLRIKKQYYNYLPKKLHLNGLGEPDSQGVECWYLTVPFRFCPHCGVQYDARQKSDFPKLATLTSEGRSTATTILSLSTIRYLKREGLLSDKAKKMLSFTDNRQDASLQAGHFNDFVEVGLLRSAIFRAAKNVGNEGLRHENLTQKVFEELNLPIELYAADSGVRFQALEDTKRALREVLGYRIYRDLKRGWRVTAPNLEQCGLLEIKYLSLNEVCQAEDIWAKTHPALAFALPEVRIYISKVLLDLFRRELAIKVSYLNQTYQDSIKQLSSQRLKGSWALDEGEFTRMEFAGIVYPRSRTNSDFGGDTYLSPRGGFANFLGRRSTFTNYQLPLNGDDKSRIIQELLEALRNGGLVERVSEPDNPEVDVPGYQLNASAMLWVAGDGIKAYNDPIRIPRQSRAGARTNPFFVNFYQGIAAENVGLEAREHTAQISTEERKKREEKFRNGKLPILFCSPTMELGVDISELNVVNMRNMPPTPANYAQRSGRAGRSGQPALVFTYCTTGSPHDQYFFKRPEDMVYGAVTTPRLDLTNEDLIKAHIHAIWLSETDIDLKKSLKDVLDLMKTTERIPVLSSIQQKILDYRPHEKAKIRCNDVLLSIKEDLIHAGWYTETWVDEVLRTVGQGFNSSCERWRNLYLSALNQATTQSEIIRDPTRSPSDKEQAKRLRKEAENQLSILTDIENIAQSDFYSYRYFASEGFLPGYSFPRLPLSAYIPSRRQGRNDEYLSRPRFLAISEFGPRAIVYHEGSRYIIDRVILPVVDPNEENPIGTTTAKLCGQCGYLHHIGADNNPDLCERCGNTLELPLNSLFRLQNVSTKRRDKINCDEEERFRLGYDIVTGARFAVHRGAIQAQSAMVIEDGNIIARMTYGDRATLWRINLGWKRRANPDDQGFVLDVERGYWAKAPTDDEEQSPLSPRKEKVIPYVEDWRNCLLFKPAGNWSIEVLASLQAALKVAIQVEYQLEDGELACEPLPNSKERKLILMYESAEGGAGVLRRLVDDPTAISTVARKALEICHFDPNTGEEILQNRGLHEACDAACYDCLMSYGNQPDHKILDRKLTKDILIKLVNAHIESSPSSISRQDHLAMLTRFIVSTLEQEWLDFINRNDCRLPSRAQVLIESCNTRPDFVYDDYQTVIYIDGPYHEYPQRQARDKEQMDKLEDEGYLVIRFGHQDNWMSIIQNHPYIFGVNER